MILSKYLVTGESIDLRKYNLGIIKQPTVDDFMSQENDLIEFMKPIYLERSWIVNNLLKDNAMPFTFYIAVCNENKEMLTYLINFLKLLYNTEDIKFISLDDGDLKIIIRIEETPVAFIDDSNFDTLCEISLKILGYPEPEPESKNKIQGDDEMVKMIKRAEEEYNKRHKEDNTVNFEELVRRVIHMKNCSYFDVKNYTVWQIQDTYKSLILKKNEDVQCMLASSGNYKMDKKMKSWMDETKLTRKS